MRYLSIFALLLAVGCNDDDDNGSAGAAMTWVQVESLARPAINEGLFITNDFLNAVNSLDPNGQASALGGPVGTEAIATLDAADLLDGNDNVNAGDVVAALIPDVMRIDTTIASPVGVSAYANGAIAFGTAVRPVAGRKIEDDVIDITLTVLVGAAVADNVSYAGVAGNAAQPGHKLLNGQAAPNGAATFPFLADPN